MGRMAQKSNQTNPTTERISVSQEDILRKYQQKLEGQFDFGGEDLPDDKAFSREYEIFRDEASSFTDSTYEKLARFAGNIVTIRPKPAEEARLQEAINTAHLHIKPSDATSLAAFTGIALILISVMVIGITAALGSVSLLLPLFLMIIGLIIIKPFGKYPIYVASKWRLRASNQMVLCILYVVMYMRHTSNLEHAIKFSAQHVGNPLALDLRKVFWDVEADKYSTIKESLDNYLEGWKGYSLEFVEAFHLIEGSLSEPSETRRIELLEKALTVMLDGTYERMLHFAQDLKSPVTILYMLGIILPILGLVIFPLISALMGGFVRWYHLSILYNIILPLGIFILGYNMLAKRPTGYGQNTDEEKALGRATKPLKIFTGVALSLFLIIGLLPILIHIVNPSYDPLAFEGIQFFEGKLLDYKCNAGTCAGPFGLIALLLSLFVPLGLGLVLGLYYRAKTKESIKIRNATKQLELEFIGSLFQLGNRVADGIPVEVAFSYVAQDVQGTPSGTFFSRVSDNLRRLGMSLKDALFDEEHGAVHSFPSALVDTSMKVLVEAASKGPQVVAKSMIGISTYVDRIHKVDERLKDLLADITSSMKSQVAFLTPLIAGIVVGVASMLVTILNKLAQEFARATATGTDVSNLAGLVGILKIENAIPTYYFQLIVGLFVIEVSFILTYLSNTIENGIDPLQQDYQLGKNLLFGTLLYVAVCFIGIMVFSILAGGLSVATVG